MRLLTHLFALSLLLLPLSATAATLETPSNGDMLSGIGVVRGWKCEANGPLTVRFDGGDPIPLAYGNERTDVQNAGGCPTSAVGFVSVWNYGILSTGTHTVVVYDDGVEFARATFSVTQPGTAYLTGAEAVCVVPDFPEDDTNALFEWNQSTQHLELTALGTEEELPVPTSLRFNGTWQFHFRLDRNLLSDAGITDCACLDNIRFNMTAVNGEMVVDGYDCMVDADGQTVALISPTGQLEGSWFVGVTGRPDHEPNWLTTGSLDGILDRDVGGGVGNWVHWYGCIGIWDAVWVGEG